MPFKNKRLAPEAIDILFLANSDHGQAYGLRARGLSAYFTSLRYKIAYRKGKIRSIFAFLFYALTKNYHFIYIVNISYVSAPAFFFAKFILGKKAIVDTGDINHKLFEAMGKNAIVCFLERALEYLHLRFSDIIITRGRFHKEFLSKRFPRKKTYQVPDGVDCDTFTPNNQAEFKSRLGIENFLTVGVLGSLIFNRKFNTCYGWDLIEALKILQDKPVKGVIIGSGTGELFLRRLAEECRVRDKVIFINKLPCNELKNYINAVDIWLCTQSNDVSGWVRVTGKLPLYLACDKYVLATDVGEAHYILPEEMRLSYAGQKDLQYPKRLAQAIDKILNNKNLLNNQARSREIALRAFDYKNLSKNLELILLENK